MTVHENHKQTKNTNNNENTKQGIKWLQQKNEHKGPHIH